MTTHNQSRDFHTLLPFVHSKQCYQKQHCIHHLFEAQAQRTPNAVAVVFQNQQLAYSQLNRRANQLAHHLMNVGVGPDVLVGLYLERSVEILVGIIGILKAGGAYLPLDLAYPNERLAFMLEDAEVTVVLSSQNLMKQLPESKAHIVCLDNDMKLSSSQHIDNPASSVNPDNSAYLIYTSGTTGKPKGVVVTHCNVVRLFQATDSWFNFNDQDIWTLFHSYAFDFSVWEIWGALFYGGKLIIIPYLISRAPEIFYDVLCKERVTVLNQTPSAFFQPIAAEQALREVKNLSLRYIIFGGEVLDLQILKPWFDRHGDERPQLVNMYGITETTVHVTYRPLTKKDCIRNLGSMIGSPIPDLQVYILDEDHQPQPVGVSGEIYVGGAGVARGYLHRPELNAERFIPDPFSRDPNASLYRSGDLAQYMSNGDIEYLGRIDHQVQIRGFRIELSEIESILAEHPVVSQVVVLVREDTPGDKRLVAYLVCNEQLIPNNSALRAFLEQRLPDYMIPSAFVMLDAIPLTPNSKVDRKALPAPDNFRPEFIADYVEPETETEYAVANILKEILNLKEVGVHDDFLELGGHSLLATQVLSRINTLFQVNLQLHRMFETPTIAEFAVDIEDTLMKEIDTLTEEDAEKLLLEEEKEDA